MVRHASLSVIVIVVELDAQRCVEFLVDQEQLSQISLSELHGLRSYHQINVALQELQQRHELIERLLIVRLIQEPVELSRRSAAGFSSLSYLKRNVDKE